MKFVPLIAVCTLLLSGCSNPRQSLGLTQNSPDEFKVVKNAPLEMPTSLTLPPPRPGAARPQETAVAEQAKYILFGQNANASSLSESEASLLQQAGAAQTDQNIRTLIDTEEYKIDESQQSVAQKLLGIGGGSGDEKVINAEEEAERLKTQTNAN